MPAKKRDVPIIDLYKALPTGLTTVEAAARLRCSTSTLERAKRAAGLVRLEEEALVAAYKQLPPGLCREEKARRLGIGEHRLRAVLYRAGTPSYAERLREADETLMAAYKQLPASMTREAKARQLGVGDRRLRGALARTGTPATGPQTEGLCTFGRNSCEALPAGSPETWGLISKEPWQRFA